MSSWHLCGVAVYARCISTISLQIRERIQRGFLWRAVDKYNAHSHIINSLEAERNHNFFCFLQLRAHAGVAGRLCHQFSAYSKNKKTES